MHQLRHGARSNAEPAKVSSYQPNHKGAEDHADQLEEILGGELAAGIMEQTESPPCFPICIRPMSVIAKMAVKDAVLYVRGWRLIMDGSYPRKGRRGARVGDTDGTQRHLAPNMEFRNGEPWFDYWSLSKICQAVVWGSCYDFKGWFRQLPMSEPDIWQNVLDSISGAKWVPKLREWMADRRLAYPDLPSQWRPWHLSSFQDDTPTFVLNVLSEWLDRVVRGVFRRLVIPLSGKEIPFGPEGEAIGGAFSTEGGRGTMGPGAAATLNFAGYTEQVQISVKTGDGVPAKVMEQMKSVAEWIATFGLRPELCLGMHRVYARRDREKGLAYPTAELLAQMEAAQERIAQKNLGPLIKNPHYLHAGMAGSADASTSDGWGAHVGTFGASGLWTDETKEAIRRSKEKEVVGDRVSISPLELLTQAFLRILVMGMCGSELNKSWGWPGPLQLILRCDNQAAGDVIRSLRPRSLAMEESLRVLHEAECAYEVRVRLEHIRSDKNVVADHLSHGRYAKVEALFDKRGLQLQRMGEDRKILNGAKT